MAVLKQIKFGSGDPTAIAFTEVAVASGSVLTQTSQHTALSDGDNPVYTLDLNISNDGTLTKDSGVLKVGTVPAAQVSVADSRALFEATNVEGALAELKDDIAEVGGEAKSYKIVEVSEPAGTSLAEYKIQEKIGTGSWGDVTGSSTIVVPKDNAFVTAQLGHVGATVDSSTGVITDGSGEDALLIEYVNGSGVYTLVAVPIGNFLRESEFKDGLSVSNNGEVSVKTGQGLEFGGETGENQSVKVKIDSSSETDSQSTPAAFLTVGANGVKVQGIKDEIDRKIAALDVTDTAERGKYVSVVSETDGRISVTRADVAAAYLNSYTKRSDATAVAATDTINQAISKLENQVDAAKTAITTAIQSLDATVGSTTVASGKHVAVQVVEADGVLTGLTVTEDDIASAQDLADEVTRAQTAEGEIATAVGLTGAEGSRGWDPTTNYGTSGDSARANMQALDTALHGICYNVDGTTLVLGGIRKDTSLTATPAE